MSGFIALHRTLLDWEWYSEPNTCRVFIHCLLKANWKDKNYRGKVVKRGHFLTSLEVLAQETGLSVRNIRTSIKNLKATNELTIISTRQGTEIIVNNYDLYQEPTSKATHELTDERQTSDKQATSTNKGNKGISSNKNIYKRRLSDDFELPQEWINSATKYWSGKNRADLNPQDQFQRFKAHHLAKGTTSTDFKHNWQTWYSNAIGYSQPKGGSYANSQQPNQQTRLSTVEQASRANAEHYAELERQEAELDAQQGNDKALGNAYS